MIVTKPKFASRATHSLTGDTHNWLSFNESTIRHCSSGSCPRNDVARLHIERTAPHMVFGAVAVIKKNTMHFGRVGMTFGLNHSCGNDTRNSCTNFVDTFNGQTNIGQRK